MIWEIYWNIFCNLSTRGSSFSSLSVWQLLLGHLKKSIFFSYRYKIHCISINSSLKYHAISPCHYLFYFHLRTWTKVERCISCAKQDVCFFSYFVLHFWQFSRISVPEIWKFVAGVWGCWVLVWSLPVGSVSHSMVFLVANTAGKVNSTDLNNKEQ